MHLGTLGQMCVAGRWRKVIAGLLAVIILPAVPAAALTFSGNWNISTKFKGGMPAPIVTTTDTPVGGTTLKADFGTFSTSRGGTASIKASRAFTFGAGETLVNIQESVRNFFNNADRTATVKIKNNVIKVTITYHKSSSGQWVNASPNTFTFTGV